jgi:hypothetical protein
LDTATRSTSPAAPGAGTVGPPGDAREPEQGLLELTLAPGSGSPPEAGHELDREWMSAAEAGSGCSGRCGCGAEDLAAELSELRSGLAGVESWAEQLARVDQSLAARAEEARSVVRLMEEVLDASVGVSEHVRQFPEEALGALDTRLVELASLAARLREEAVASLGEKAKEIGTLAERTAGASAARVEAEARRVATACDDVLAEFRDARRFVRWGPWVLVAASAVLVVLALTLLRPGWTMSAEQRRALRIGESVVRTYSAAGERERAEIRRALGWHEPEPGEGTATELRTR